VSAQDRLAETVRVEGRRILATLDRTLGDLQLAEDAVQDATVAALRTWPRAGIPEDPRAWLTVTARHKAYDALRRETARPVKETTATWGVEAIGDDVEMEALQMTEPDSVVRDDLLRLVFICCHPALALEAQVALALRTLAGLDVSAIARALLVNEPTMAKRLVRARQKIAHARIPYRVPTDAELPERIPGVLGVVHIIATEAHAPSSGEELARVDLEAEALRLARLLCELMPDEAEVLSLLALLLLVAARRPARTDDQGRAVLLADQNRSRWDQAMIPGRRSTAGGGGPPDGRRRRALSAPGSPGRVPRGGADVAGHRLEPHRGPLRPVDEPDDQPRRRAQSGGGVD